MEKEKPSHGGLVEKKTAARAWRALVDVMRFMRSAA